MSEYESETLTQVIARFDTPVEVLRATSNVALTAELLGFVYGDVDAPMFAAANVHSYLTPIGYAMDVEQMREHVRASDVEGRTSAARIFAHSISATPGVQGVFLTAVEPDLVVTVLTSDHDMERELELRRAFIEVMRQLPDSADGDLDVLLAEEAPPSGELGQALMS